MVTQATPSGPGIFGVGTELLDIRLAGLDRSVSPLRPPLFSDLNQLGFLLVREQCPNLDQCSEAVLVKLGLRLPDDFGLLHHSGFVRSLLREELLHPLMQAAQLPTKLPCSFSGFVDDLVDRLPGLIIQTELRRILCGEPVGSTTRAGPTQGGLRECHTGDGHSREQNDQGSDEISPTHILFLFLVHQGFAAIPTFRPSKRAPGLRPYPSRKTLAIAR